MNPAETPAPHDRYLATKYFRSLDGIRCFSVLAVLAQHSTDFPTILPMTMRGFLGVDMFFVLSGFLIANLLLAEKSATGDISLPKFYARRTLRIFPIYYGLLAALGIVYGFFATKGQNAERYFDLIPYYLLYVSNWIVPQIGNLTIAWSLAAEEQFYLVWPTVEKFLRRRAILVFAGLFLVLNQLINFQVITPWLDSVGLPYSQLSILQITFTPITFGILLAHAMRTRWSYDVIHRWLASPKSPLVLAGVLLLAVNVPAESIGGWPRLVIQMVMTAFLASCVVREDHALVPTLTFRPAKRLGEISYGMYLFHPFAIHASKAALGRVGLLEVPALLFLSTAVLTVIIAELSFRFYETPILRLRKRFRSDRGPASTVEASPREATKV